MEVLGYAEGTYLPCHTTCCMAGYCGLLFENDRHRHQYRVLQEQEDADAGPACPDCQCADSFPERPLNRNDEEIVGRFRQITSNGIPSADAHADDAAVATGGFEEICQVPWSFTLPTNPGVAATPTPLPATGVIGVAIDGVPLRVANMPDGTDPVADGASECYGHGGTHHDWAYYHFLPCGITAGSDEACVDTPEDDGVVADCVTGYTPGDATTPSTTCPAGCTQTDAMEASDASCAGTEDGDGNACALSDDGLSCAADNGETGDCAFSPAVSASDESCVDTVVAEVAADCVTGYTPGDSTTPSTTCPADCTLVNAVPEVTGIGGDTLVGYALDGFPIYNPLPGSKDDIDAALDACNGLTVDGQYRYYARTQDQVGSGRNYLLGCFSGVPTTARIVEPPASEPEEKAEFTWGYMATVPKGGEESVRQLDAGIPREMPRVQVDRREIFARTPHAYGQWAPVSGVFPGPQTHHALYLLRPDTLYYVQVQAYNKFGDGPWSTSSYALHTHAVPDQPKPISLLGATQSSLTLQLNRPGTRGSETCDDIELRDVPSGVCTTWGSGSPVIEYEISILSSWCDSRGVCYSGTGAGSAEDFQAPELLGCTDPTARNYNPEASKDDGLCVPVIFGCTDPDAFNYDPTLNANTDKPGLCIEKFFGCTDVNATNFNEEANVDDESCWNMHAGCTNPTATNWDTAANVDDGSCIIKNVWIGQAGRRLQDTSESCEATVSGTDDEDCSNAAMDGDAASNEAACLAAGECTYTPWYVDCPFTEGDPDSCNTPPTFEECSAGTVGEDIEGDALCDSYMSSSADEATNRANCEDAGCSYIAYVPSHQPDCMYTPPSAANEQSCTATVAGTDEEACADVNLVADSTTSRDNCQQAGAQPFACTYTPAAAEGEVTPEACGVAPGTVGPFHVTVAGKQLSHPSYGIGSDFTYRINNQEAQVLTLTRGRTYIFSLDWAPGTHPFYISSSPAGGGDGAIQDGVEGNFGTGTGQLIFTPGYDLPSELFYQCFLHDYMGFRIDLVLDRERYPPPQVYPECIERCWLEEPPVDAETGQRQTEQPMSLAQSANGTINITMLQPYALGEPGWLDFGAVCNFLASLAWGCNNGTRLDMVFDDGEQYPACMHECVRTCNADVKSFVISAAQTCGFGCDGDATTGDNTFDQCGVCGGDGSTCGGCMEPLAENYDPTAVFDDGSCEYIEGCTNPAAFNYNPAATMNTGCVFPETQPCHQVANPITECTHRGFSTQVDWKVVPKMHCVDIYVDPNTNETECDRWEPLRYINDIVFNTTGCPDHTYTQSSTCDAAVEQEYIFEIPVLLDLMDAPTGNWTVPGDDATSRAEELPVGIAVNGVPIYSDANGIPLDVDTDGCLGQVDELGRYQYRQMPLCLMRQLDDTLLDATLWDNPDVCECGAGESGSYLASSAAFSGAYREGVNAGSESSDGFYGKFSEADSGETITWTARSCIAGNYDVQFRYSNGDASRATSLAVDVNGVEQVAELAFPWTDDWVTWTTVTTTLTLVEGTNTIALRSIGSGGPNVDSLEVSSGCPNCGEDDPASVTNVANWPQESKPSPLVGWALDGFPIYGPYDEMGNLTAPVSMGGQLDECGFRRGADGRYRYHITPTAPSAVGCFRGTPGKVEHLESTSVECAAAGWVNHYVPPNFTMPQCNPECMPLCVPKCVREWSMYERPKEPFSGLLPNGWVNIPAAPRIYHVPGSLSQYVVEKLDPCTNFAIRMAAVNAAGKGARSEVMYSKTDCRPQQPPRVTPIHVGSDSITVQWGHAAAPIGTPILAYKLFIAQGVTKLGPSGEEVSSWAPPSGSNNGGDWTGAEDMFVREAKENLTNLPVRRWNLKSDTWVEVNLGAPGALVETWTTDSARTVRVKFLEPASDYKFRVVAVSAAGESYPSFDSIVVKTLDAEITQLQMFAGQPCITNDDTKMPFHAVSDGTNVQYAWRSSWGGRLGVCATDECAAMMHAYSSQGVFQAILYASNSRGFIGQMASLDVRFCGCPEQMNQNYWFASQHTLPRKCAGYSWDDVNKELTQGTRKMFSVPIVEKTFGAQVVVRVDIGVVDVFVSITGIPDSRMPQTYQLAVRGVKTFTLQDLDYDFLYDEVLQDYGKVLYISVEGVTQFSRFDIYAHRRDFSLGPDGPALRRNLETKWLGMAVTSGYYDFWEYYFPEPVGDETTDITVSMTVKFGCLSIHVSKYERYPSPLRAHGTAYGHDASLAQYGCAGTTTDRLDVTLTYLHSEERSLFVSVWGGKVYTFGSRPPVNSYDIEATYNFIAVESAAERLLSSQLALEVMEPEPEYEDSDDDEDTTADTAENRLAAQADDPELYTLNGVSADVPYSGWKFYEVLCDEHSRSVTVLVTVTGGQVLLYQRGLGPPARGAYDHMISDSNDDGVIEFKMDFNQIGEEGKFYVGVWGVGGGLIFDQSTYVRVNSFTIRVVQDTFDCLGDYYSCGGAITELTDEQSDMDLVNVGEYKYYSLNMRDFINGPKWDNSTGVAFAEPRRADLFTWRAPLSDWFINNYAEKRTANAYFKVRLLPVSREVSVDDSVTCVLYTGTDESFPGHSRTCDSWLEYTFDSLYLPGTEGTEDEQFNVASLMLPIFEFTSMDIHFSVTCDDQLAYSVEVVMEQFDRAALLSGDVVARSRLCPGQNSPSMPPCSGHGTCIDEGTYDATLSSATEEVWTTPSALCHCDAGYVGFDCSIERYPTQNYLRFVEPVQGETVDPLACAPCVPVTEPGTKEDSTGNIFAVMEDQLNMTNREFFTEASPYRRMYDYDQLVLDAPGAPDRMGCPSCGQKGVQVMFEVRAPSEDCEIVAYVDGEPHAALAEGDAGIVPGNSTHRLLIVNLRAGSSDQPLPHSVQLFLTWGEDQVPIGNAFVQFYVGYDAETCPNDCSGHGVCHHGYCVCFDGWVGTSCAHAGGQPPADFEPMSTYASRINMQLEQAMASEAAGSAFVAEKSDSRLRVADKWMRATEVEARERLDEAAAHNRKEMQAFLAAQAAAAAGSEDQQALASTDWRSAFEDLDRSAQQLLDIATAKSKVLEHSFAEVERRLAEEAAAKALKAARLRSLWRTAKEKSIFNLQRLQTMNGPRVPIDQLERQECTIDRLHQIECQDTDASESFEQAPGYFSHVYLDPHDNIVTEEQEVENLYSDIPR
jgi:hypothetical protein